MLKFQQVDKCQIIAVSRTELHSVQLDLADVYINWNPYVQVFSIQAAIYYCFRNLK
jgi:hypothetical protein